jgi:hypothetical protein
MHVLRTFIIMFAAGVVLAQQADVTITPNFIGDDIEKSLQPSVSPKSEFETTAQYEARRAAARMTGKQLVLLLDDAREETFKYDADTGMMTATIPTSKVFFLLEPNRPTYQVIKVHKIDRQKDEYTGQNAYGAERRIERLRSTLYGVVINQNFNSTLVFPLDPNTARETKPYLHLGFACTVTNDALLKNLTSHEPTIKEPYDVAILENYVQVALSEFFVFDARTGVALLRFHPNDSADVGLQTQTRRKLYPLELQIGDSGLVYVQVDGGREEMAPFNGVIRAKQQIHLKLQSQYSQPSFVLNGSPYTPRWRIYNKDLGSFSMFDHAEALITVDSQQPVSALGQHKIGETYSEWLMYIGIDQKHLCKANKPACKNLSNIEKTGAGIFYTTDNSGRTVAWRFVDHAVVEITPQ